jgi:hypothetical protein
LSQLLCKVNGNIHSQRHLDPRLSISGDNRMISPICSHLHAYLLGDQSAHRRRKRLTVRQGFQCQPLLGREQNTQRRIVPIFW